MSTTHEFTFKKLNICNYIHQTFFRRYNVFVLITGDILLEMNGFPIRKQEDVRPFLSGRLRRLAISIIPVGRRKEYKHVLKRNVPTQNQPGEWGRVKRAKSLHDRVGHSLVVVTFSMFIILHRYPFFLKPLLI